MNLTRLNLDRLAQQIVNYSGGLTSTLKPDFNDLVGKASVYLLAKGKADNYRKKYSKKECYDERECIAEQTSLGQLLAEAYKAFLREHPDGKRWFPGG